MSKSDLSLSIKKIFGGSSSESLILFKGLGRNDNKIIIASLNNRVIAEVVLSTIFGWVEQSLNKRALADVGDDPEDMTALTSDHFRLGSENANFLS